MQTRQKKTYSIWAETALLPTGWADKVEVTIKGARIDEVTSGVAPNSTDKSKRLGILLPAPVNAHSHAFQRAMAGLTEGRGKGASDSFWTWRQLMYLFLDRLTPDQIEVITAFVHMEMLEAGYGASVEFHYLHHGTGGAVYDNIAETSTRIMAAAETSGIGLTLLPVHYQYGGCDKRALVGGQKRFGNDLDRYLRLYDKARDAMKSLDDTAGLGLAVHSLRAVAGEDIKTLRNMASKEAKESVPFHMHLAEQTAEVEEVQATLGVRPVEWAIANLNPDRDCTFIHCTQMESHETHALAKSGAVAGLCPITESSLGDGIFSGRDWLGAGGAIAVGSDSNIRISLSEELRCLEYSQRLRHHTRATLATAKQSTGRCMFDAVLAGGAQAAGRNCGAIAKGKLADLCALDATHIDMAGRTGDTLLDSYIFAGDDRMITDVIAGGRHMVTQGQHIQRETITAKYRQASRQLNRQLLD